VKNREINYEKAVSQNTVRQESQPAAYQIVIPSLKQCFQARSLGVKKKP
jgi:hypothetical protein